MMNSVVGGEDEGGLRLVERESGRIRGHEVVEEGEEGEEEETPFDFLSTESPQQQGESFCTKYKLERGSLSAFKREARSIRIGRNHLPGVKRQENVICVWKDKGHGQFLSAASKQGLALWFTLHSLIGNLKYFFQVSNKG
eukprot:TRINITY_DN11417_c0_g1_i1.p1 TRINITY_DN11417_c0_g1~~TRINITY_DN11417_c0_g1_i1.p1  ORF type:complete len:140 (+),score=36.54 TRINITY_DN11417_c0_g1_i1:151-570(+)